MKSNLSLKLIPALLLAGILFSVSCSKIKQTEISETYLPNEVPSITGVSNVDAGTYLGRALFYDKVLSKNNAVSCASCHKQANAFADNMALSTGFEGRKTTRNSIAIQNIGNAVIGFGFQPLFWDGRENDLGSLITKPIENHIEMGMDDMTALMKKINERDYVKRLTPLAFGTNELSIDQFKNALVSFLTTIRSDSCRLSVDKLFGTQNLTPIERRGEFLFNTTYQCARCHQPGSIAFYNENSFANIGLDASNSDIGLMRVTKKENDRGRFKIPDLHNVMLTAPYMHDGRFATIDDVLEHYSHGILKSSTLDTRLMENNEPVQLNITTEDREALKAFLTTLTDYKMITNPNLANPFKTK